MTVIKTTGVALALLLGFQVSSLAETTRVETHHKSKHRSDPSRVDIDRSHRYIQPQRVGSSQHRRPLVQTPRRLQSSGHMRPAPRRIGNHVTNLHHNAYNFRHNGHRYRYRQGVFYRPYNRGFRMVQAPIGAIILSLPLGYTHIRISDRDYYRYNDVYYQREFDRRGYRVVPSPFMDQRLHYRAGDMIDTLPLGARAVIIDNVRYYEYNDYYFKPKRRGGVRMYLVVDF